MKKIFTIGIIGFALVIQGSSEILVDDDFSGPEGSLLAGSSLDSGGVWSNVRTDGSGVTAGTYVFADGGGVVLSNDVGGSVYTSFPAESCMQSFTNGLTVSMTFSLRGYDGMDVAMGLAEQIDKGHFINLVSDDVLRLTYYTDGTYAGRFRWGIYESGELVDNSFSTLLGAVPANSNDLIRLSITCYPASGMAVGEAYNVDGDYLISRSGIAWNSPALTNMLYAGMGLSGFSVVDLASPAVIRSFQLVSETLSESRSLSVFLDAQIPVMTGFAFEDCPDASGTNYAYILDEHQPVDILHGVRASVRDEVRAAYPDKMIIQQLAWGGTSEVPLESVWPGHCLLKVGTTLSSDCSASNTVLYLDDYTTIAQSQSVLDNATTTASYAVLYALDENGDPDWSQAEHVRLTAVDTSAGTVTVERGQLGTTALDLTAGNAVLARHMMFWSNQWQINFSLECPRGGPFNMTGAEWYALQMAQRVFSTGSDGIEFDVARWQWGYPSSNPMDCDNDLTADYGYIDGVNSFGLGGQVMLKTLRELLGPNRIIQMDGNDALFGQRGFQYVNGVQMESFPKANQFDRFSEAFSHLHQWINGVEPQPAFSYPFTKTTTTLFGNVYDDDGSSVDWHFRVGFAAALLSGMPHPFAGITDINFDPANPGANSEELEEDKGFYKWDEYVGGHLNDWKWLGAPQGEAFQCLENMGSSDLLASTEWQWTTENGFGAECSVSNSEYAAEITGLPSGTLPWASSTYSGTEVPQALWFGVRLDSVSGAPALTPGAEYTLEFEAKGNDSWTVDGQTFEQVPRSLTVFGIADYDYHEPLSVLLNPEWTDYRISVIASSNSPQPLCFGVSEQVGSASLRNIRLYEGGSERWMREFENGRIYLNMTQEPWVVNVDTGIVQRLDGTQIPELNSGAVINGQLTIPVQDAVFLRTGTFDAWQSGQFSLEVADDFSFGFDGRNEGNSLAEFPVQDGLGIWSNVYTSGSGSLNGNMTLTTGGLTESAGQGGGVYIQLPGQNDTASMKVVLTPNDFSSGSFSMGFSEMINKGYFSNLSQGDVFRIRYIPSGVNAGRFQFGVYDDGVLVSSVYSTRSGSETVNTSDTVRLELSYHADSGDLTGTAFNVSGDYELSSSSLTLPGVTNMIYAGFGWTGIPDQDVADGGPSDSPGIISSFRAGSPTAVLDELISGKDADPDDDGFSNLQEYVVGSDPFDDQSLFSVGSEISGVETVLSWSPVSGRSYDVYWSSNLFSAFIPVETNIVWPRSAYTNLIPTDAASGFYQIRVRR